ncbi:MAG: insulinase family protein [Cyclobacteriaceae bacterium]|nr:insulinase family protein [Cyclobacteriaceae bacterium]
MREYEIYTLRNGIRVIHNRVTTTKIVHCGIMLDIGSRDETSANQGIAHFWEHMAFKGTRRRKAFHIINRLESLGGELNAFTDKEKILFYASLRDDYFERALELLTDITFDSIFPASQIERERQVILEEMMMYLDDPDDSLQDEFDGVIFAGHSLGMNILGTEKTVRAFKRKNFQQFIRENLDTRRVVFSCVGNIPADRVIKLAEKYLGTIPALRSAKKRTPFKGYKPREVVLQRTVKQARCAIGRPAYSFTDTKRSPFYMLTSILGGSGMNSRLNLALREKHGFVYSIGAQYVPFTDTGLFAISFGTEPSQLKRSIALVKQELKKLSHSPLGVKQLASCKEQILGQIAMAEENNVSFMMMMARNILDQGRVTSLDEIFDRVKHTSAQQLQQLADEMFREDKLSYLVMEPAHGISA